MAFIKIKPAISTNIVRHPNNLRQLKPEGEEVDHNSYWERRLKDGDVVIVDNIDAIYYTPPIAIQTAIENHTKSDTSTDTVKTHGRESLQENAKIKNKTEDNT